MRRAIYWATVAALFGVIVASFEVWSSTHGTRPGCDAPFPGAMSVRMMVGSDDYGKAVRVPLRKSI